MACSCRGAEEKEDNHTGGPEHDDFEDHYFAARAGLKLTFVAKQQPTKNTLDELKLSKQYVFLAIRLVLAAMFVATFASQCLPTASKVAPPSGGPSRL